MLEVTVDRTNKPTALNFIQVGFRLEIAVPINVTLVSCIIFIVNIYAFKHVTEGQKVCSNVSELTYAVFYVLYY